MKSTSTVARRATRHRATPVARRFTSLVTSLVTSRGASLASLVALLALVASAPSRADVKIVLHPQAEVTRPTVSLNDIAELTTSDLTTLRRLMNVPLGNAPQPGKMVSVSSASLQSWVRARLGGAIPVRWSGASRIEIVRAGPAVARGSFAAMTAHSGGVAVETRVEVLQDGEPGQQVRVRMATASTSILARVLASGRVEAIER